MGTEKSTWVEAVRTHRGERTDWLHWRETGEGGICGQRRPKWEDTDRSHSAQVATAESSRPGVGDYALSSLSIERKGG